LPRRGKYGFFDKYFTLYSTYSRVPPSRGTHVVRNGRGIRGWNRDGIPRLW